MPKSEVNAITLLAVLIAGSLTAQLSPMSWPTSLSGIILLVILFAYDREGYRTTGQSAGFGAVCGFCSLLAVSSILQLLGFAYQMPGQTGAALIAFVRNPALSPGTQLLLTPSFAIPPLIWIAGAILFFAIDRSRMGARATLTPQSYASSSAAAMPIISRGPAIAPEAPPVPPRPVNATSIFSKPPVFSEPETFSQPEAFPQPVAPPPAEPVEPPAPPFNTPLGKTPPANAVALPIGAGKPATIYLNLVGEGLACLRSVQAEHLGKDYYRIVEPVPAGETWEFQPGQVVRCQKRNLSNGKAMVAVEEAPRAT